MWQFPTIIYNLPCKHLWASSTQGFFKPHKIGWCWRPIIEWKLFWLQNTATSLSCADCYSNFCNLFFDKLLFLLYKVIALNIFCHTEILLSKWFHLKGIWNGAIPHGTTMCMGLWIELTCLQEQINTMWHCKGILRGFNEKSVLIFDQELELFQFA